MSAIFGTVGPFDGTNDTWDNYTERLGFFFQANGIEAAPKKKAILLSVCGANTYKLIRSLLAPTTPEAAEYDVIVKKMKEHTNPKPTTVVQRFRFNSRSQRPDESVLEFVAALRHLSNDCEFGDTLSMMLRDRLVCGVEDERIQRRLLQETDLTFDKALNTANAMETAARNAVELQTPATREEETVHRTQESRVESKKSKCYRCLGGHSPNSCYFQKVQCHKCKKTGHIARACQSESRGQQPRAHNQPGQKKASTRANAAHHVESQMGQPDEDWTVEEEEEDAELYTVHTVGRTPQAAPLETTVSINRKPVRMEVDTGAAVSLVSEKTFYSLWKKRVAPGLRKPRMRLHTYSGEQLEIVGEAVVRVCYETQAANLPLIVVRGDGPNLLDRNWMKTIRLQWKDILQASRINDIEQSETEDSCTELLKRYAVVFRKEMGQLKGAVASLKVKENSTPRFYKPRPVPYAFRGKVHVEQELKRLQQEGTIEPVRFSEWAAPIVPILKPDGTLRLCGDYRLTINQVAEKEKCPLPIVEDIFARLAGGQTFTKLDLSHAYQQVELEEQSKQYLVINTHMGLFRYNRLPFGVAAAPTIFQRLMDSLLQGIPGTIVYLDDILITGASKKEHLENLQAVLHRLTQAGVRLKREKCLVMQKQVQYLGHRIDRHGIYPTEEKVQAVLAAPQPRDVSQLRAYLGLINYYGKFLRGLATILAPLYKRLHKGTAWAWGQEEQAAFEKSKAALRPDRVLVHFDHTQPLTLACDASPWGVGAVLSHQYADGTERPIAFASRSLSKAEQGYAQVDREALGVIFGVKRFRQYLYGQPFTIFTDHTPLLTLLGENKGVPTMCSGRVQRWALMLSSYDYKLVYRPGAMNSNADGLSRLPVQGDGDQEIEPAEAVLSLHMLEATVVNPMTAQQLRRWTERDPILARVRQFAVQGWPGKLAEDDLKPYWNRRHELSVLGGCVFWGSRVVVPPKARVQVLEELHVSHPGETRMKGLARSYVWWPKIDQDLERIVRHCHPCQVHRNAPATAPMHPWAQPEHPWTRLYVDFAGPFLGQYFLIVVDAFSKWLEVESMTSITARATIKKLQRLFATHGIPEVLVTDNGPAFISAEFEQLMKGNGIKHITISPYHPATNGLAERAVATFKSTMKKCRQTKDPWRARLTDSYFNTESPLIPTLGNPQHYSY